MKRLLKISLCVALCAALLLCTAAPAFAATDSHSYTNYSYGVSVNCNSVLNAIRAKGSITLSFVPNLNHLTESEYSCGVEIFVKYANDGHTDYYPGLVSGMSTSTIISPHSDVPDFAEFFYYINTDNYSDYWVGLNY
ncbi:MAG: hypothetical protein IJM20_01070 [Clostridia bacterium]|nr:hypothetical protein [Clostridia bacterium]